MCADPAWSQLTNRPTPHAARANRSRPSQIHLAFVSMVERLLEEFVAELGLDAEQFTELVARSGAADREQLLQARAVVLLPRSRALVSPCDIALSCAAMTPEHRCAQAIDAMTDFDVFLAMVHDATGPGGLTG
jgi:hypothetical protein